MEFISLGIDVGNGFVKYDGNNIFMSRVALGELSKANDSSENDVYQVEYEGLNYIVGTGNEFITSKRHMKDEYLLCMLTAIAKKSKDKDICATTCIGVPVDTFQDREYITKINEKYNSGKQYSIKVNGISKNIRIQKCAVITESAYPLLTEDNSDIIVIDVGTGTISVVHWKNKKIVGSDFRTYSEGLYVLANKINKIIKNMYKEDLSVEYILSNLGKDKILINQREKDFSFHKKLIGNHITAVSSKIVTDFRLNEVEKIYVQGGGAKVTIDYWKEDFEAAQAVSEGQYINSKVYQKYADVLSRKR